MGPHLNLPFSHTILRHAIAECPIFIFIHNNFNSNKIGPFRPVAHGKRDGPPDGRRLRTTRRSYCTERRKGGRLAWHEQFKRGDRGERQSIYMHIHELVVVLQFLLTIKWLFFYQMGCQWLIVQPMAYIAFIGYNHLVIIGQPIFFLSHS